MASERKKARREVHMQFGLSSGGILHGLPEIEREKIMNRVDSIFDRTIDRWLKKPGQRWRGDNRKVGLDATKEIAARFKKDGVCTCEALERTADTVVREFQKNVCPPELAGKGILCAEWETEAC